MPTFNYTDAGTLGLDAECYRVVVSWDCGFVLARSRIVVLCMLGRVMRLTDDGCCTSTLLVSKRVLSNLPVSRRHICDHAFSLLSCDISLALLTPFAGTSAELMSDCTSTDCGVCGPGPGCATWVAVLASVVRQRPRRRRSTMLLQRRGTLCTDVIAHLGPVGSCEGTSESCALPGVFF